MYSAVGTSSTSSEDDGELTKWLQIASQTMLGLLYVASKDIRASSLTVALEACIDLLQARIA
jgi:hypothetical protein